MSGEVAATVLLLCGAGLLLQTLLTLVGGDTRYRSTSESVLTLDFSVPVVILLTAIVAAAAPAWSASRVNPVVAFRHRRVSRSESSAQRASLVRGASPL